MDISEKYQAGVMCSAGSDDENFLAWSHHASEEKAVRAARLYARRLSKSGLSTGGAGAWDGWVLSPDGTLTPYGC